MLCFFKSPCGRSLSFELLIFSTSSFNPWYLKLLVLLVFILLPLLVNRYCVWLVADTVEGRHSHQFVCLYLEVKQDLSLAIFKLPWGRCA